MTENFCADPKILMKDGAWIVPESDRPDNWRDITLKECFAATPSPNAGHEPIAEIIDKQILVPEDSKFEYPLPPEKYAPIFLPIFEGLRQGLLARRELLDLTQYCMELEIALQEQDLRRVKL